MDVLVVESPAKAKTIGKYLGPGFTVLASYGHVRDLPPKDGSVRPDEDFAMDWLVDPQSQKRLDAIAKAVTKGGKLYLATDPDREGEAISWHVRDVLKARKALDGVDVKRVTFNAITKQSVLDAVAHPRELDQPLIDAYHGAPRARLSRGLHPLARAVAQAAGQPLGRPRAIGGAAPDLRARVGDRGLQDAANTGRSTCCSAPPRSRR